MSQCPLCHGSVKDDFGLIECSGCGAQLIVHMDGRVEYHGAQELPMALAEEEPSAEDVPAFAEGERILNLNEIGDLTDVDVTQMKAPEDLVQPEETGKEYRMPEDDLYDASQDSSAGGPPPLIDSEPRTNYVHDFSSQEEIEPASEPSVVTEAQSEEPAAEVFFDGNEDGDDPAPVVYSSAEPSNSPDLSDVARFGNSDMSGGRDGSLRYNLFIEGIDTSDVREAFRHALTDRKLMWDIDQILRTIRNGRVSIPNVAPTKAYILISRLRGMPVQVRWEQYAISQT